MADDVDITAGSGTTIKTDDVSGSHVQYVKLMDGTADGTSVIPGDSTTGLDVHPKIKLVKTSATGSAAISASYTTTASERLCSISLHFSSAPTTSEDFTVTIDANDGAAYDYLLVSIDPSVQSITDYIWFPDGVLYLEQGDAVDLVYTNTDARTYGVQITTEKL